MTVTHLAKDLVLLMSQLDVPSYIFSLGMTLSLQMRSWVVGHDMLSRILSHFKLAHEKDNAAMICVAEVNKLPSFDIFW